MQPQTASVYVFLDARIAQKRRAPGAPLTLSTPTSTRFQMNKAIWRMSAAPMRYERGATTVSCHRCCRRATRRTDNGVAMRTSIVSVDIDTGCNRRCSHGCGREVKHYVYLEARLTCTFYHRARHAAYEREIASTRVPLILTLDNIADLPTDDP